MTVLKDDKFENAIRKRINNMHADYGYYSSGNRTNVYKFCYHNPLSMVWELRINLRLEYVNKKIDENYKAELRRLMS